MEPKVSQSGATVTVEAPDEATAREIAGDARYTMNKSRGVAGMLDNAFEAIGDVFDVTGARIFDVLAWVFLIVGAYYAFTSFSRINPSDPVTFWGFGFVGAGLAAGVKFAASRWAKETVQDDKRAASAYRAFTLAGLVVLVVFGAAFQASVDEDQKSGLIDQNQSIGAKERELRNIGYELEDMRRDALFSGFSQEDLQLDLQRAVSRPAYNSNNTNTGQPVGDFVSLGTPEFCQGTSYYVERYCPDLLEIESRLRFRVRYDEAVAKRDGLATEIEALRNSRPEQSSIMALADSARLDNRILTFLSAALLVAIIDVLMIVMSYMATWSKNRKRVAA
ncbi:MAG: hypothetical protein AAFQ22_07110 [Pseudomonadota bacterium]